MKQWKPDAEFDRNVLSFFYTLIKMNAHSPGGRGQHADPVRDVLIYAFGTVIHEYKRLKRPGLEPVPPSWNEVYRQLEMMFFGKRDEIEVVILMPAGGGRFLKLRLAIDDFETAYRLKFAAIGPSGIRAAFARGKKILKSVHENMERSDLITTISMEPVKYRIGDKRIVELVPQTRERHDRTPAPFQKRVK
jgi:hypothetical protein